ncbi:alpha-amylase family glycosyl hydrolase [Metabacillus idriensis]|uniref:alpha-amylase family glycosyl hydrolase n=1 Tax=Metabacillus idriensis TaxID=324768 RepID=UPI000911039B|nr:alpha-amylase family glycosyl hydrolase [Metabacillus idriensis]OHR73660.1 hypothetical protein HMPREF3291_18565 [Bacillus sp. HMSC76G11]
MEAKRRLCSLIFTTFLLIYAFPVSAIEKDQVEFQDESIYFLMIDRFNNGNSMNDKEVIKNDPLAYQGGDFKGVEAKLDYLKEMGFTSIVLTPIFENEKGGYHGYWITDFYKTNPQFGSIKEFKNLINEAHDRGIKVLVDFPVTHVSSSHPWVKETEKAGWFTNKNIKVSPKWLGNMAVFNLENNETRQELINAAKWWINKTDLDGYYLSNATDAPIEFWNEFAKEVKAEKEDFFLLGESRKGNLKTVALYEKSGLDAVTNPQLTIPLRKQFTAIGKDSSQTTDLLKNANDTVGNPRLTANFFDNYMTERFTRDMVEEKVYPVTRWKLALTYLYTIPGLPLLYYGSEIALDGSEGVDNHRVMDFRANEELIDRIKKMAELRQELPALKYGTYTPIYENNGMTIFKREYKKETLIIAINNTSDTKKVSIPVSELTKNKELRGLLVGDYIRPQDDKFTIILNREESEIYALAKKTGINFTFIGILAVINFGFLIFFYVLWKRSKKKKRNNN